MAGIRRQEEVVDSAATPDSDAAEEATEPLITRLTQAQPAVRPAAVGSHGGSTLSVAQDALAADGHVHLEKFAAAATVLLAAFLPMLLLVGGDPLAKLLFASALLTWILIGVITIRILRVSPAAYPRLVPIYAVCGILTLTAAFYFFGPFSAIALVFPVSIFHSAMGHPDRRLALGITIVGSIDHAALVALTTLGVIHDRGVYSIRGDTSVLERALYEVLLIYISSSACIMGLALRRAMVVALDRHGSALRALARREGLLAELRHDLAQACRPGGEGRYTGMELGSFTVGELIGRGEMGEVYEAEHRKSGEPAAVKLIGPEAISSPELFARFEREIEIVSSLRTPHVVRTLETSTRGAAVPYLAMERLRGESLAERLRRTPRLEIKEAIEMLRQVGKGVAAAHEAGVVHRDLKPSNLYCHKESGGQQTWKLLDFGVSKLASSHQTLTGAKLLGTPGYMAPEQAMGREVDHRADVYSLGMIAYRVLTGQPPFSARQLPGLLFQTMHEMPVRPSAAGGLPRELDLALILAVAKDAADRYDSIPAMLAALTEALRGSVEPRLKRRAEALSARTPWKDA